MPVLLFEHDLRLLPDLGEPPGAPPALTCLLDLAAPCNLRCKACPREGQGRPLDPEEALDMGDRIVDRAASREAKRLDVAFFGGEPLLQAQLVTGISERIRRAAEQDGVAYRGHVITNGTVLGPLRALRLADAGLGRAQVTLEGPRRVHDRRRRTLEGDGTWRRIVDNLKFAREGLRVVVRANLGAFGLSPEVEELVEALDRERLFEGPWPLTLYVARPAPYAQQARDLLRLFPLVEAMQAGVDAALPA